MPLEADDQARVDEAIREAGADLSESKVLVLNAADSQKLGPLTVICIMLNRMIGRWTWPGLVQPSRTDISAFDQGLASMSRRP